MAKDEIKIIGDQILYDRIAVADLRKDALPSTIGEFKDTVLKANSRSKDEIDQAVYDRGYEEGYSDAMANSHLES